MCWDTSTVDWAEPMQQVAWKAWKGRFLGRFTQPRRASNVEEWLLGCLVICGEVIPVAGDS